MSAWLRQSTAVILASAAAWSYPTIASYGQSHKGTYTGANRIRFIGTQVWTYIDKPTPISRACTIDLTRTH